MSAWGRRFTHPFVRTAAGFAVSAIFIALFLRNTDFSGVFDAFTDADVLLIVAALGVYFVGIYFRAVRWSYLMSPITRIAPHRLFPIVAIGFGVNNVLPFRAGEVVRAHVLRERHGVSRAAGLSSIFMARVFDGMMLTIFLTVGVAASLVNFEGMPYAGDLLLSVMAFLLFGVSAAFVLIYAIAIRPDAVEQLVARIMRAVPLLRDRDTGWVRSIIDGLGSAKDPRLLIAGIWTSAVAWGLEAFMYFLVGEGFGLDQPFPVYLLIAAGANIILTAPSTAGGVGPFEWAAKEVLLIYLVVEGAEEVAIAYAASLHGLVLIPIALVGLSFLWWFHVPFGRIARGKERTESESRAPGG
jgi:uncharacterized protein (TIRG00374 family)